jgi:hypothetical protein
MIADVVIFFAIGLLVAPESLVIPDKLVTLLIIITIAFSVLNFLLVSAVKNVIAQLGVLNSVAFYGLLLALLGFPMKTYIFFYLAALIGMILKRPVERAPA